MPDLGLLGGGAPFGFAGRWLTLRRAPPLRLLRPLRPLLEPRPACASAVFVSARHHPHQRPLSSPELGAPRLPPVGCFGRLGLPILGLLGGGAPFGVNGRRLTLRRAPPPRLLRPLRPLLEPRLAFAACASAVFVSARACASRVVPPEAIISHQRPSLVIRGNQRSSEVIRGHQAAPERAGAFAPKEGRGPQEARAQSRCARAHSRCAPSLRQSPAAARRVGRRPRLPRRPSRPRATP